MYGQWRASVWPRSVCPPIVGTVSYVAPTTTEDPITEVTGTEQEDEATAQEDDARGARRRSRATQQEPALQATTKTAQEALTNPRTRAKTQEALRQAG